MELADFLLARIAEDEAVAQGVVDRVGSTRSGEPYEDGSGIAEKDDFPSYPWGNDEIQVEHMRRHDPRRVLAECEAKRLIVELHPLDHGYCEGCGIETQSPDGCLNLRALALPYADHDGYRSEWRIL